MMKLYVGNLPLSLNDDELRGLFSPYGEVKSVNVIKDRFSGESRGFGFVEMEDSQAGQVAIDELNGKDVNGRAIKVSEAQPRVDRPRTGGMGGGPRRGGGGGGFGGDRGGFGGSRGGPRRSY